MPPARAAFYAATGAALPMTLFGIFVAPLPLEVVSAAALGYVAFLLFAVLNLNLGVFVDAVVRGPRDARGVALTFDDGPDPIWTRRVMDALDEAKVKATFFVIARKAEKHADVVKEILARGHSVGLHSYAHDRLFSLRSERRVRADLTRGMEVLTEITGERPTLFRPPIGHTTPPMARVVEELDLTVVGWTVSARDGTRGAKAKAAARRVRDKLADGAIVLMHDASERDSHEPVGVAALPAVLRAIRKRGLEVVPLANFL
ncbi:MAG: polysaccharide deacetylase family protein [Polyangiaceae bacterium]